MTRTHTPPRRNPDDSETYRVQRACNGCGRDIGDATANELDAAIDGASLPDVRDECGCSNPVVQAIAKAMCDVDHDWDFPCRDCIAAAVPLVAEARQQMLNDVAVLFARNRDVWIETRRSHPEQWDEDAEYAYAEGARVLAAWAEDPSRMDGPLKAARSGAMADLDPGAGAADTGLPASDPSHDRGTNRGRGGEPSSSVPAPDLDAIENRANAATGGYWRPVLYGAEHAVLAEHSLGGNEYVAIGLVTQNAQFIAHARGDIRALLALVRAKESWIDGAKIDMAAMEEEIETLRTARNEVTASKARIVAERDDLVDEVEQLRNTRDPFDYYGNLKAERDTARAAVARVRALHVPEWVVIDYVGGSVCRECREPVESEPCATIRALDGAS